jgi:hypothetical protein
MRIRSSNRRAFAALLLAAVFASMPASATLYGVAHDRTLDHELLVRVSAVDATITDNAAVALDGCCQVSGSLVASDDGNQTVYLVTPDPDPALAWRLHRISLATGAAATALLPVGERIAAILRRPATSTLYALSDAGAGLRLVTVSNAGAVTGIGAPFLADCCGVRVGVAALSNDASRIAFVGRLQPAANDPATRLFVISTSSGAVLQNTPLAHAPDLLLANGTSGFSAIYHDAGSEFVGTIAGDGSITPVGAGLADCCALFAGVGARTGNLVRVVARELGATALSLYEVNVATGTFTAVGALDSRYVINGLVESNVNLAIDLIFRDGFDPGATAAGAVADADGLAKSIAAAGATRTGPGGAASESAAATALMATTDDKRSDDQVAGSSPSPAALPLGGPLLWGLMGVLLMLVGIRFRPSTR